MIQTIQTQTKQMIDDLKSVCNNFGIGGSPSEYKIITETFLYKFLNDKFLYEVKKTNPEYKSMKTSDLEEILSKMDEDDYEMLLLGINADTAIFKPKHFISALFNNQNAEEFYKLFDSTLLEIAQMNSDTFSTASGSNSKILLFGGESQDEYSKSVSNSDRGDFCQAVINKIAHKSFEAVFEQKYDFFSTIFEYLIKDYNKDFGKYAEYYTPHAISSIIAKIMAPDGDKNVTVYDPSAGSGTLVLSLAHEIGEQNCTIYTQDISQKSNEFLRLNLILNNLVHSLHNVIREDTLLNPRHLNKTKDKVAEFDYIVSNPPFKTDFSDTRDALAGEKYKNRFFCGVPNVLNKAKDKMEIYLMFLQHIIYSLKENGKAAIVVPTGFLTASERSNKIAYNIRKYLIDNRMLRGVISMPSKIFANTGTNVSIVFIDKQNKDGDILFMDASKLGTSVKEDGKNQKTVLSAEEISDIINTFRTNEAKDDFSISISYDDIEKKKYSFSAGQYFEVKIEYVELTQDEFNAKMNEYTKNLENLFSEGDRLQNEIMKQLKRVKYE